MGTRYVVSVMKIEDVEGSENRYDTRDTTLFEATHVDAARLARFAPVEVLETLATEGGVELAVDAVVQAPGPAETPKRETPAELVERVFAPGPEGALPQAVIDATVAAVEAPKRKRRTKAEIAADSAAQAAGFRDAAHQAEAERESHPSAGADPTAVFGWPAPTPSVAPEPVAAAPAERFDPFSS
jgi:hypothetical protein